jgi:polyisoprenoid-binding protein YceI
MAISDRRVSQTPVRLTAAPGATSTPGFLTYVGQPACSLIPPHDRARRRHGLTTEPAQGGSVADVTGIWNVDPASTTIEFHTKAMWLLPVKGRFRALSGSGMVGEDGSVTGHLTMDAASIDTGNARRDKHLRSADFFEVESHPSFTFDVAQATSSGVGRATLDGSLTIKGASRPLQVPVSFSRSADAVDVEAEIADLDRREWGLTWARMGTGVHNRLVVHAHFVRG